MGILSKIYKWIKAELMKLTNLNLLRKEMTLKNMLERLFFLNVNMNLIYKTHSYNENMGDYIESTLYPDFLLRCKKTKKEFYAEAKFRRNLFKNKIEWSNDKQLKRYKDINKDKIVFVCIGFKETPNSHEQIFIIPVSKINFKGLYLSAIDKYSFFINKPVFSNYLWKL